jgi:hypothetical protein
MVKLNWNMLGFIYEDGTFQQRLLDAAATSGGQQRIVKNYGALALFHG